MHSSRTVHYHAVNRWQLMMLGRMGGGAYFTSLYLLFLADSRAGTYP